MGLRSLIILIFALSFCATVHAQDNPIQPKKGKARWKELVPKVEAKLQGKYPGAKRQAKKVWTYIKDGKEERITNHQDIKQARRAVKNEECEKTATMCGGSSASNPSQEEQSKLQTEALESNSAAKPQASTSETQSQQANNMDGGGSGSGSEPASESGSGSGSGSGSSQQKKVDWGKVVKTLFTNNKGRSADSCSYGVMAPDVSGAHTKCKSLYTRANHSCDANKNTKLQNSMKNVRRTMDEVERAAKTSVKQACKKYNQAVDDLRGALNDFVGRCDPLQSQCQLQCSGTVHTANQTSDSIASDPFCGESQTSQLNNINQFGQDAGRLASSCGGFQQVVQSASNDAHALMNANSMAQLCSTQVSVACDSGDCDKNNDDDKLSSLSRGDSQFNGAAGEGDFGEQTRLNTMNTNSISGDRETASLNGSGRYDPNAQSASGPGGAHSLTNDHLRRGFQSDSEDGLGTANRVSLGASAKKEEEDDPFKDEESVEEHEAMFDSPPPTDSFITSHNEELENYLPGGKMDPKNQEEKYPDGITGGNGRTLFEKVSDRYSAHTRSLNSFSNAVNSMSSKELQLRVRRKMGLQDLRK